MNKFSDLISTVSPILNGQSFIDGLARNIGAQELQPFQQIYSNNSSDDDTWLRLQTLEKKDSIVLHSEPNRLSAHGSWMAAASLAHTEYVLLLPCDDRIHPLNIKNAHQVLQKHPNIDVIGTICFATPEENHLLNPFWQPQLTQSFQLLSSDDAFALATKNNFLAWPFTGLILRTRLFLDFLSTKESAQFEGACDIALTLWLISKNCAFAHRHDALTLAFRHQGQESSRLSKRWLSDYIKLVEYLLDLKGLSVDQKLQACSYFMKVLPKHLYTAIGDPLQDPHKISSLFLEKYPSLIRRCSAIDQKFSTRLCSHHPLNELGRRLLLSMGPRRLILAARFLKAFPMH